MITREPDGAVILTYSQSQIAATGLDVQYNGLSWKTDNRDIPEAIIFTVNKDGIIIDFHWENQSNSVGIDWYGIGHTVVIVGLIALFVYVMHFLPSSGDWVG